jgi:sugar lactone lactonase YvrE
MFEVDDGGHSRVVTLVGAPPTPVVTGLNNPTHVAVDSAGNLYITDSGNNRVIKVPVAGGATTTLVSGLNNPASLAVDSTSLYITDSGNNRVIKVPVAGGATTTLASSLNNPASLAVDSTSLYISVPMLLLPPGRFSTKKD